MSAQRDLRERRRERLRYQLKKKSGGRLRLSVFRSGKHIYAQVIDDAQGRTLAAAGSLDAFYEDSLNVWDWAAGALIVREAGGGRPAACRRTGRRRPGARGRR